MKYRIAGADRGTGEDKTIEVEAFDERQATLRAKAMNLLVENIELTNPVPDYQSSPPENNTRTEQPSTSDYANLQSAATGLAGVGTLFSGLGWAAIIVGLFGLLVGVVLSFAPQGQLAPGASITAIAIGLTVAAWGTIVLFAGELGRTVAEMGRAMRELTINSRR
jgi:hypothetical protein